MFGFKNKADLEIVREIKSGNKEALTYMFRNHYAMVRKYILSNSGSADDVDDLLQDAVIAVWQNVNKPGFELSSKLSTYLMAIVKNTWLKQLKKKSRVDNYDGSPDENMAGFTENLSNTDLKLVVDMVNSLNETCRKLLSYYYFDGLDMNTIAGKLNFANADTAKSKKYQCFKKLENMVKSVYKKSDFI